MWDVLDGNGGKYRRMEVGMWFSITYWIKQQWRRFIKNPYKYLWSKVGGRPWTFILRDLWHKFEFLWIVALVSLGVWLGHHYNWGAIMLLWLVFSLGYIAGHLFWGKEYTPDEEGK